MAWLSSKLEQHTTIPNIDVECDVTRWDMESPVATKTEGVVLLPS